jgi:hypothetical protein
MPNRVQKFFTLVGLLKYGIVLSLLLIYLPLTALDRVPFTKDYQLPGHDIAGNMFVELSPRGVLFAMMFLLAVGWSIMFTEGLIVNAGENRFDKSKAAYRSLQAIRAQVPENKHIPHWADVFFAVPVTGWQFLFFTIFLAGPSFAVIVWRAEQLILALVISLIAFVIDYFGFILLCTPAALLDTGDPPLRGFPLAEKIWSWFGYRPGVPSQNTRAYRFSRWLQGWITAAVRKLRLLYLLDPGTHLIYPIHFLTIIIASALLLCWIGFDWTAYPGAFDVESAPVVYIYASLLLFVWLFAAFNFHLGRLHISSIAVLLIIVVAGYMILGVDHDYDVTREQTPMTPLSPVDSAKGGQGGPNLVVVASAGGGIWAAGWTGLALEKLIGARPELAREIRLLSTVSGGSVGAANYVQGLLNDPAYRKGGPVSPETLRSVRIKSVTSSLEAAAYGVAFRDFPRLVTGGVYNGTPDRGYLLEHEWARIAAGTIERDDRIKKGARDDGRCWAGVKKCGFLDLTEVIRDGTVPAVIFNATVMELGRRIMITPLDFAPGTAGRQRGQTLSDFLFTDPKSGAVSARANLPFWTAARLSATFSFVSPAVRTNVINKGAEKDRNLWRQHIVDGGYYDNYGVASALDWLEPVLEARQNGATGLNFSKVLIIQLRGFAEKPEAEMKPSPGAKAALIGPLDALFAIRVGVAISRNTIDVDRFIDRWNRELKDKVEIKTVEFVPDIKQTGGPLSWHLSKADIENLKASWGKVQKEQSKNPQDDLKSWNREIRKNWCELAKFLGQASGAECDEFQPGR